MERPFEPFNSGYINSNTCSSTRQDQQPRPVLLRSSSLKSFSPSMTKCSRTAQIKEISKLKTQALFHSARKVLDPTGLEAPCAYRTGSRKGTETLGFSMHYTREKKALAHHHPIKVDIWVQHLASARMTRERLFSLVSLCEAPGIFLATTLALITFQIV